MSPLPNPTHDCLPRTGERSSPAVHLPPTCPPARAGERFSIRTVLRALVAGLAMLGLAVVAGCEGMPRGNAPGPTQNPPTQATTHPTTTPVTLAAGDVVKLAFPGAPEFNNSQKIRMDGKISLPSVGEIQAAGKTLGQLRSELTALYKQQLTNSEVVATLESGGARVLVSGAVAKPGSIPLQGSTTVLQAIMESGGFTDLANQKKVHLIREANGEHRTEIYDLRDAMKGKPAKAITVRPGDMIYVPAKVW